MLAINMEDCFKFKWDIRTQKAVLTVSRAEIEKDNKLVMNLLYESLDDVCHRNDIHSMDITDIDKIEKQHLDFTEISKKLLKLLTSSKFQQVKVSNLQVRIIKGTLQGLIFQEIKKSFGEQVSFGSYDLMVQTKDLLSPKVFLDKIVSKDLPEQIQTTINTLNNIDAVPEFSPMFTGSVIHAYKYIRRVKKISNRDERRLKEINIFEKESEKINLNHVDGGSHFEMEEKCEVNKLNEEKSQKLKLNSNSERDYFETTEINCEGQNCAEKVEIKVDYSLPENSKGNTFKSMPYIHKRTYKCYVCKKLYCISKRQKKMDEVWKQYPCMCLPCAQFNLEKRNQKANMEGKYAIVTGGRIKIGYELVLKLLRDGCFVIVTSRFPHDATKKFAEESDFMEWKNRLKVYPLDLKDILGISRFVKYVKATVPHLDVIINNAAQTLRRPLDFYRHLLDYECIPQSHLKETQQPLLATTNSLYYGHPNQMISKSIAINQSSSKPQVEEICDEDISSNDQNVVIVEDCRKEKNEEEVTKDSQEEPPVKKARLETKEKNTPVKLLHRSFSMDSTTQPKENTFALNNSQNLTTLSLPSSCQPNEIVAKTLNQPLFNMSQYFPRGAMDDDGQQLDLRRKNSWRTVIDHVPLPELMEVLMVNAVAPFIINKDLKSLLQKSPSKRKFIVNVSAMEGQFNRTSKTKFHPHTNMAKAALNMMTRTAAIGYKEKEIYMTSVDTGWVTDERPLYMAKKEQRVKGFKLPLDCVDGAARIYDPIVEGLTEEKTPHYAVFLKDYKVYPW